MIAATMQRYGFMITTFGLLSAECQVAKAGFVLTAEKAGVQSSQVAGVTTEDFEGYREGIYTSLATKVGTFSSSGLAIVAADQYGGAGGTGRYESIGVQSGTLLATLTLNESASYFGFWWSAADPGNQIAFYQGSSLLAQFNPGTALSALGSAYFGNPNAPLGRNSGEKYAYLNFIATNGTTFDRIVFRNQSFASGFEVDNFSYRVAPLTDSGGGTPIDGGVTNATPEPSSLLMVALGLGLAAVGRHHRVS